MAKDAEELVAHLRRRLDKQKIVVLGFSWGSTIGVHLAARRPEWIAAYVGVGQAAPQGEEHLYRRLLELADRAGNEQALKELHAIAPYPGPNPQISSIGLTRKWARQFNGGWYGRPDFDLYFSLPDWAPEYSQAEVTAEVPAMQWAERNLVEDMFTGDGHEPTSFEIPVIMIMGRYDLHTPYSAAKAYFDRIRAPNKRFVTLERSAHFPMFEEPGLFLLTLVQAVLPLAGGRVEFTRDP
jgi:pimeloyl-ACP methyl ester carboxylesterase